MPEPTAPTRGGMCGTCPCMGGMPRTSMMGGGMMPRMSAGGPALYAMQLRQQQAALLMALQARQQPNALWWPPQQFQFNPWAPAVRQQPQNAQLRGAQKGN